MLMRVCDICKREIRKTEGRYKLVYIGRLYDTDKDVCADCIKRIAGEIKQADTPQTKMDKCYKCKWWNYSYGCSNKKGICDFEPTAELVDHKTENCSEKPNNSTTEDYSDVGKE